MTAVVVRCALFSVRRAAPRLSVAAIQGIYYASVFSGSIGKCPLLRNMMPFFCPACEKMNTEDRGCRALHSCVEQTAVFTVETDNITRLYT